MNKRTSISLFIAATSAVALTTASSPDLTAEEFEGKYDLEELLDPDGPAPWGETEDV